MSRTPKIWYTSDLHFLHEKVALLRGFKTSREHDMAITTNWWEQVSEEDTVYILGDVAADQRTAYTALEMINELSGEKIIIAGNHDPFHPKNKTWAKWEKDIHVNFDTIMAVAPFARRKLAGHEVMLSHFPYVRDRDDTEPRDMQYRLRNEGNWLLHGHTHTKEIVSVLNEWGSPTQIDPNRETPDTRITREIHVGLDAHGLRLVSQDAIIDIITNK